MADNLVEILIKFGLDKSKATEAAAQIKDIQTASTEAGNAGVKAEAEVTEATKKTFASKKSLKDMVKELGREFPILGQLGRLALNPIAAATTAAIQGTNLVEGPPAVEINYVPPLPPGTIRLSTTVMRSDNPLGPWTVVTNLQTIELAADANQGFYRSRMDVK